MQFWRCPYVHCRRAICMQVLLTVRNILQVRRFPTTKSNLERLFWCLQWIYVLFLARPYRNIGVHIGRLLVSSLFPYQIEYWRILTWRRIGNCRGFGCNRGWRLCVHMFHLCPPSERRWFGWIGPPILVCTADSSWRSRKHSARHAKNWLDLTTCRLEQ